MPSRKSFRKTRESFKNTRGRKRNTRGRKRNTRGRKRNTRSHRKLRCVGNRFTNSKLSGGPCAAKVWHAFGSDRYYPYYQDYSRHPKPTCLDDTCNCFYENFVEPYEDKLKSPQAQHMCRNGINEEADRVKYDYVLRRHLGPRVPDLRGKYKFI